MSSNENNFFSFDDYLIDEKMSVLKFTNAYRVFNGKGEDIGAVQQEKISGGAKAARLLLGRQVKGLQAFKLDILDANGSVVAAISRGGAGGGLKGMRVITIYDGSGKQIGTLEFPGFSWTPKMEILDVNRNLIGRIAGDWRGWNFTITDTKDNVIGNVNKKWNGLMKEAFTSADKYRVSISPHTTGTNRVAILAAAITLDMVLHEN